MYLYVIVQYFNWMISNRKSTCSKNFFLSSDAVSEVLDFITMVGILMLSLSLIGLVGYPALRSAQETRYIENTRQSFIVVAESINKIAMGSAPSRGVELKMYGGSLMVTGNSTMQINATNSSNINNSYLSDIRSVENSVGDTVVAYEGTGVWIKYQTGTVLNPYRPLITYRNNVLVIPVVHIAGISSISGTGISHLNVCQEEIPSDEGGCGKPFLTYWGNVSNITITITGPYSSAWMDYFKNILKWDIEPGGTYTARLNTAEKMDVYILKSTIRTVIL
jgi:hypothetical protein